jgi:CheY-like chemotaxis protein
MRPRVVDGGRAALVELTQAAADGEPFPLVLLDGHMPEMDGFTLAARIQQSPELADTTVLMLTSAGHPEDIASCRELGISAYLLKPVKQSELLSAVQAALGRSWQGESPAPAPLPSPPTGRPLHILLAEDNLINQKLAVRLLEKEGHTVVVAGNGREALDQLESQPFDLVLMDVEMPELDGLTATALIRQKEQGTGRHLPIIAMTAHALKGDRERCLAAGMDSYIPKPVRPRELFEAIAATVEPPRAGNGAESAGVSSPEELLNWNEALDQVGGDTELLRELVGLFLETSPKELSELREAIARGDCQSLKRLAHTIKGTLGVVGARAARSVAQVLETKAQKGDLTSMDETCVALEKAVERLRPALLAFLENKQGPA